MAVALLSLVSLAAVQLLNMTERTMIGSQTNLNQQLRSESIASYIYKDFARGELDDAVMSRTYTNDNMPEDLRTGTGVTVVSLYGKANRFNGVDPRCPLERAADPADGTFRMPANCMTRGGQTIVQQMNDLIGKGIILTTGLQGGIGRSRRIQLRFPESEHPGWQMSAVFGHARARGGHLWSQEPGRHLVLGPHRGTEM